MTPTGAPERSHDAWRRVKDCLILHGCEDRGRSAVSGNDAGGDPVGNGSDAVGFGVAVDGGTTVSRGRLPPALMSNPATIATATSAAAAIQAHRRRRPTSTGMSNGPTRDTWLVVPTLAMIDGRRS